uniref:Peptidase aspartic putative domain-containing protein n=1 Tax=Trichobilharzia regenti TaxID=157069 RepID=A0AA85K6Z2_TRIRE|nr:unnamed protein product [Trichobilharzia regenti]
MGGSVVVDSDVDSDVATELEILELKVQELRLRSKQRKLKSECSQQVKTAASCVRSCANPSKSQLLDGSTNYCAEQPPESNCTATPVQPLLNSVSPIRMPQIEMDKFDGTPTKFLKFIRCFNMFIGEQTNDDNLRLMHLIHNCVGTAKEAIEHCILLPSEVGYRKAMGILRSQFGQPHAVSDAFLSELLSGPQLQPEDIVGLQRLLRQMTNCEIALSQMNHMADLDCSTNLKCIVQRLPLHLRWKWAELVNDGLQFAEPSFRYLKEFLERQLSLATSCYGQIANGNRNNNEVGSNDKMSRAMPSHSVNVVKSRAQKSCIVCFTDHDLWECQRFLSMSHKERLAVSMRHKVCFNCLKLNHRADTCRAARGCDIVGCTRRHHKLLHNGDNSACQTVNYSSTESGTSFLGYVPIRILGPKGFLDTYAFLDNGSDATLLLSHVARQIGLEGVNTLMQVTSFCGTTSQNSSKVDFEVESLTGDYKTRVKSAYTVESLPVKRPKTPSNEQMKKWPHLAEIPFLDVECKQVSLLIGTNVPEAHWVLEQRIGKSNQPFASLSVFGWYLLGSGNEYKEATSIFCLEESESVENKLLRMIEAEFQDKHSCERSSSEIDKEVLKATDREIRLRNGHYEVPLTWKEDWRRLPPNRSEAERRLDSLQKKLRKDESLLKSYNQILTDHELKCCISRVPDDFSKKRRFIPHHPVINPRKPGKIRVVFDCAFKCKGMSLNDCLYSGPDLIDDLAGVLLRFRKHRVALSADIEEMFLQVHLPVKDKSAFSFLWYSEGRLDLPPSLYESNVHPFGATSSPFCAAYASKQAAIDNAKLFDEKTLSTVRENFYVDDCLVSVETVAKAIALSNQLRQLASLGGFRLHKWNSNNEEVLSNIPVRERSSNILHLEDSTFFLKTLGLCWCVKSDCFKFEVNLPVRPITKRGILSCIASLYDPLGYVAPLLLPPKRVMQHLCRSEFGWDEHVDVSIGAKWEAWLVDIKRIKDLEVQRCFRPQTFSPIAVSMHLFSDASEIGFGSVAYLRYESCSGEVSCSFVMGKSRVAPLKHVTVPRLELQAAVLSVKLLKYILEEIKLELSDVYLWTDSMIVLSYIRNTTSRFKTYIANRVGFTLDNTTRAQWRHVPTNMNSADLASRGIKMSEYERIHTWLDGPGFLKILKRIGRISMEEACQ